VMWTAQLTYRAAEFGVDEVGGLAAELGAGLVQDVVVGTVRLMLEVAATTARQATLEALRVAGAAVAAKPVRILVMSGEDFVNDVQTALMAVDLLGVAEIAQLFGVSRQRVNQLIGRPDFPVPVARLLSGPVFTKPAVEAFEKRWAPARASKRGNRRYRPWPPTSGALVAQPGAAAAH
jgi:hypothetical protein